MQTKPKNYIIEIKVIVIVLVNIFTILNSGQKNCILCSISSCLIEDNNFFIHVCVVWKKIAKKSMYNRKIQPRTLIWIFFNLWKWVALFYNNKRQINWLKYVACIPELNSELVSVKKVRMCVWREQKKW